MSRNVCITAVDGNTGFLIAELLLKDPRFSKQIDSLTGLALNADEPKLKELEQLGATVLPHVPGDEASLVEGLKGAEVDTVCIVPPAKANKLELVKEVVSAATKAGTVTNTLLISSAGCDYAERDAQPRLREFIDIEALVLASKGEADTPLGHSPCVIRAGFYAENLLLYDKQAQKEGLLPLPIGPSHKFAPVALGDVAHVAAHVLSGKGKHGFDDKHRGQMMVITGPMLSAGEELAEAASQALGTTLKFKDISEAEAKKVLKTQADLDESEKEYLLDYYSLVREGKTNYISTTAFHDVTGDYPTEPTDFFKLYEETMRPVKKQKVSSE
ncbi:Prestalk A differentiation protein A [Pleurostoma richardsiae]|uniref:Prestalk A differentiation protein A n=1 Tax=Pleurostoma richardsiae TaxID=41990 RepID=A0AA38RST2_9PEZI|nr:Prestalk A differentiation protein A [Pleurostoma richardsiae]